MWLGDGASLTVSIWLRMDASIAGAGTSGEEGRMTFRERDPFWVQRTVRGVWHIETIDDPEKMLCGAEILVESDAKVQTRPGLKECPWCVHEYERMTDDA